MWRFGRHSYAASSIEQDKHGGRRAVISPSALAGENMLAASNATNKRGGGGVYTDTRTLSISSSIVHHGTLSVTWPRAPRTYKRLHFWRQTGAGDVRLPSAIFSLRGDVLVSLALAPRGHRDTAARYACGDVGGDFNFAPCALRVSATPFRHCASISAARAPPWCAIICQVPNTTPASTYQLLPAYAAAASAHSISQTQVTYRASLLPQVPTVFSSWMYIASLAYPW